MGKVAAGLVRAAVRCPVLVLLEGVAELEDTAGSAYQVVHAGELVLHSASRAIADPSSCLQVGEAYDEAMTEMHSTLLAAALGLGTWPDQHLEIDIGRRRVAGAQAVVTDGIQ